MSSLVERIIGIALIVASLFGLLLNIIGLVYLPRVEAGAQSRVSSTLAALNETLATTEQALTVVDQSLDETKATLDTSETATRQVAIALGETGPLLDTFATITGETLPGSLGATQIALNSAQEGAVAVEQVLYALNSSLSFLGGFPVYDPQVSLATTLATVSTSLDPLPQALDDIEQSLTAAGTNLELIRTDIGGVADNLSQIGGTLDDAKSVTAQYRDAVTQQQAIVTDLEGNADIWIVWTGRVFGMILIWLMIAQLGLLSQGVEMVLRSRRRRVDEAGRLG